MKNIFHRLLFIALLLCLAPVVVRAVEAVQWRDRLSKDPKWLLTTEARTIADDIILYQYPSGGWPKNIDMAKPLSESEKAELAERAHDDATIDNGSTYTQIRFLGQMAVATQDVRYCQAVERGIDYLLAAQLANGGWAQYFPERKGYYTHITFNDDAMINVMALLRDVAARKDGLAFIDASRRERCRVAVEKGIACILRCQITVNGVRTAWCAQHDEKTFAAAPARKFEPASLSGYESVGIVRFLMGIEKPSPDVIEAVTSAVAWFEQVKIGGIRVKEIPAPSLPGGKDRVVIQDPLAPPLWARFYEIGTNRPIFSGRDSIIRYSLAEIEHERRVGYKWYVDAPAKILKDYPRWSALWVKKAP